MLIVIKWTNSNSKRNRWKWNLIIKLITKSIKNKRTITKNRNGKKLKWKRDWRLLNKIQGKYIID